MDHFHDLRSGRTPRARLAVCVAVIGAALGCTPGGAAEATTSPAPAVSWSTAAPVASSPASGAFLAPQSSRIHKPRPKPRPKPKPRPWPRPRVVVVLPPAAARFDYQLGGAYTPPAGTGIVERDRGDAPAPRSYGICYVNAFQTQPEELSWWTAHHPGVLLANAAGYVQDPDWPGEVLFDTSSRAKRAELLAVVGAWIDQCAATGFKAVEPDNLDSWTRSEGLLTAATNTAFAATLTARAHARGLAVAQKNTAELAPVGRSIGFDFAVAEECQVYGECDAYMKAYGPHVLEVEYTDNAPDAFAQACLVRAHRISIVLRDRDLVAPGQPGYTYQAC